MEDYLSETLAAAPKPLGLMATNDAAALSVLEVCRTAEILVPEEIARTSLFKAFGHHVGRTIWQGTSRRRVQEAWHLLTETDLKARQIAREVGFTDIFHMNRTFHRVLGTTPTDYRAAVRQDGSGS